MQKLDDIGECMAHAYESHLSDWVDEMKPGLDRPEDIMGLSIREVEVKATMTPGGKMTVSVHIIARRKHQDLVGFYRFERRNGGWLTLPSTSYGGRVR